MGKLVGDRLVRQIRKGRMSKYLSVCYETRLDGRRHANLHVRFGVPQCDHESDTEMSATTGESVRKVGSGRGQWWQLIGCAEFNCVALFCISQIGWRVIISIVGWNAVVHWI